MALAVLLVLTSGSRTAAQEPGPYQQIAAGNQLFEEGRFDEALAAFESAAAELGDSPELDYNRAAAHYKLDQFADAAELFDRASLSPNPDLSRRARFNWGNCDYAQVLEALQSPEAQAGQPPDLNQALEGLQSAITHYRDALDVEGNRPTDAVGDRSARENIERAQKLIELIKEQQEQQQQQQQQQDQDQQNQDQQDQQQNENQQRQQDQQEQKQQDEQQQSQQNEQQEEEQQQTQPQQEQKDQQGQEREMTPQEVEAVLQAVRDKEKERREQKAALIRAQRVPVSKDW